MRSLLAASLGTSLAVSSLASAGPAVEPLPANTRALANDVAGKATAEQKAWATEVARRRPMPGYEALRGEVRARFATHRRMSEHEVSRLAFLGVVMGFDNGVGEIGKKTGVSGGSDRRAVALIPTPTPPARHAKSATSAGVTNGQTMDHSGSGAEVSMIELQSLVAQRQMAVQMTTSLLSSLGSADRTVAANIGR